MSIMGKNEGLEKIVHIIPLGHEIDRAVTPFREQTPDRVYLLAVIRNPGLDPEMVARQQYFVSTVKSRLKKGIEVITVNTDMFDLPDVIRTISHIIRKEKALGNRVSVNMSACGRLTSVGAVMAAMAHGVNLYYVMADDYARTDEDVNAHGLSICRSTTIKKIVGLDFVLPDNIGMEILVFLYRKDKPMRMIDIFEVLRDRNIEGFETLFSDVEQEKKRGVQSRQLMKLDKTILTKLERNRLITREKTGRNVFVSLTESGRYVACLSGLVENETSRTIL
jgi:hypothetical protein